MVTDWIIAFRRTEMVWDDTMQEPTAADHGDVLYNIGVNQTYKCSCFRLHFHKLPTSFVNTITSTNFTFTFMLQQNRGIIANCCVSPVKFFLAGKSPMIGRYMEARRDIHPGEVKITKCPLLLVDQYHFRLKSLFKSHLSFSCASFSI